MTVTIDGANDAPVAVDDAYGTSEDAPLSVNVSAGLLANDSDPDSSDLLSVEAVDTTGTVGLVSFNADGSFTYDPNGQFESLAVGETATDTFSYTVSDGQGGTATASVTVTIDGANDAPVAVDDAYGTSEEAPLSVNVSAGLLANDSDPDSSDLLSVEAVDTTGTVGLVSFNADGNFTYDPNGQFESLAVGETATDTFSYTVSDGQGGTATASVTVTIDVATMPRWPRMTNTVQPSTTH